MNVYLKKLLVFSIRNENCFYTEFNERFNIIKGKNTSGKSTLIQSIIYAFGINDGKEKLSDVLKQDVIFRLDLIFGLNEVTFIRDNGSFYIFTKNKEVLSETARFDGINSDNSNEHIKLKETISKLFNFDLILESKGNAINSPLEVMLLPSYISQSVGWVYLRESFSNLNYYKDFKVDYLDYHLGVLSSNHKLEFNRLNVERNNNIKEINFLNEIGGKSNEVIVAKLIDEKYIAKSSDYLEEYRNLCEKLIANESKYIELCNLKSLNIERKKILKRIENNQNNQKPKDDSCPVCTQILPNSLEDRYKYFQEVNNTNDELFLISDEINKKQSAINSTLKKINEITERIENQYENLLEHTQGGKNYSLNQWIDNKVKIQYYDKIENKISNKIVENERIDLRLNSFQTDADVENLRDSKDKSFSKIFIKYLKELKVSIPIGKKYINLYSINSFPFQGVELHKTVMAYHFAFNVLIMETQGLTIFPFLLDAVMKEDIDEENRNLIFNFISKNAPMGKQVLFSVSESISDRNFTNSKNIEFVKNLYFSNDVKIIQIGDGIQERTFLTKRNAENEQFINETMRLLDNI